MLLQGCNAWASSSGRLQAFHVCMWVGLKGWLSLGRRVTSLLCSPQELDSIWQGTSGQPSWVVMQDAASRSAIDKLGNMLQDVRPLCID